MSVSNGQNADDVTFNSAFFSQDTDSTGTAKYDLNNTDILSGDNLANLQKFINNGRRKVSATLSIIASGTIVLDEVVGNHVVPVIGNSGAQDANTVPFTGVGTNGNAYLDGTIIVLIGTDDTNTVKFQDNDASNGMILNGEAVLSRYSILTVMRVDALSRWIEIGRDI